MSGVTNVIYASIVSISIATTMLAVAQEHKILSSQLPSVVAATVNANTAGATIKGFTVDRDHGRKVYEVETIVDHHTRDLEIAEDGTLNEIEEEVKVEMLPSAVKRSLEHERNGGAIKKVESLTKAGKLVAFEAVVMRGSRSREIQFGPDGSKLLHEE